VLRWKEGSDGKEQATTGSKAKVWYQNTTGYLPQQTLLSNFP